MERNLGRWVWLIIPSIRVWPRMVLPPEFITYRDIFAAIGNPDLHARMLLLVRVSKLWRSWTLTHCSGASKRSSLYSEAWKDGSWSLLLQIAMRCGKWWAGEIFEERNSSRRARRGVEERSGDGQPCHALKNHPCQKWIANGRKEAPICSSFKNGFLIAIIILLVDLFLSSTLCRYYRRGFNWVWLLCIWSLSHYLAWIVKLLFSRQQRQQQEEWE